MNTIKIEGPTKSGKTTLAAMVAHLLKFTEAVVTLDSLDEQLLETLTQDRELLMRRMTAVEALSVVARVSVGDVEIPGLTIIKDPFLLWSTIENAGWMGPEGFFEVTVVERQVPRAQKGDAA